MFDRPAKAETCLRYDLTLRFKRFKLQTTQASQASSDSSINYVLPITHYALRVTNIDHQLCYHNINGYQARFFAKKRV